MFFIHFICSNLLVRRTRSLFTIFGVAIATGAVVALMGFSRGLEKSFSETFEARGTDAVVMKTGSRSVISSDFPDTVLTTVRKMPGVGEAAGLLNDVLSIEEAPTVIVMGWERGTFLWDHLQIVEGRLPGKDEKNAIVLGQISAEVLGKNVGDPVQIDFDEFHVTGIVASASLAENSAAILPLDELQRLFDKQGRVNFINLRLTPPDQTEAEWDALTSSMREALPSYIVVRASEMAAGNSGVQIAHAMSWATSSIALLLGAFGVTNTILMSVFERIREIGILLAIGWQPRRIVSLILGESIILTATGGSAGILLAFGIARILERVEPIRGKIVADLGGEVLLTGALLAIVLGLLGGLYPAWYASRLQPTEALRHE